MWSFLKKHYKAIGSVLCGVAASGIGGALGDQAQGAALGVCAVLGLSAGKEYVWGKTVGDAVRAVLPAKKADGGVIVTKPDDKN